MLRPVLPAQHKTSPKERESRQTEVESLQFGKRKPPRGVRTLHNLRDVRKHKLHLSAAAAPLPPPCDVVRDAQRSVLSPGQLTARLDDPGSGQSACRGDCFIREAGCSLPPQAARML